MTPAHKKSTCGVCDAASIERKTKQHSVAARSSAVARVAEVKLDIDLLKQRIRRTRTQTTMNQQIHTLGHLCVLFYHT